MKRVLLLLLTAALCLSCWGCGEGEERPNGETTGVSAPETTEETEASTGQSVPEATEETQPPTTTEAVPETTEAPTISEEEWILEDPELVTVGEDEDIPDITDLTIPREETEEQTEEAESMAHVVNILLVGQDSRAGESRSRSDSMTLVTFNRANNTITLTSFMRDAYVTIPDHQPNKLNAAYAFGGMELLSETLAVNYGVTVDGVVEVNFDGFEQVIDLLGGVEIELTGKEADYLNSMDSTAPALSGGTQLLNGTQALNYSRIRKLDSDYNRANRQRKVLMALLQTCRTRSTKELTTLLDDLLPLVTTNMGKIKIAKYLKELAPMLREAELNTLQIPAHGTFRSGNARVRPGLAAWFQYDIDFEANRRLLQEIFAQ